jgi:formylglycine-generating enzyme required for sulfatase activity
LQTADAMDAIDTMDGTDAADAASPCAVPCLDRNTDPNNCGALANRCGGQTVCRRGACTPNPLSCARGGPGMTNCGGGDESCCTSLTVSTGPFFRTYANTGVGPTNEGDPATISSFRLDKYDVTVGRFRQFVTEVLPPDGGAGWLPSAGAGKHTYLNGGRGLGTTGGGFEPGWDPADSPRVAPTDAHLAYCQGDTHTTWTTSVANNENLPINCVAWWEAWAFCIWDGGFLPSEAEWEYAAAGGSRQRSYPWGSTDPGTANSYAIYGCYYPSGSRNCAQGTGNIAPVGTATLGAGLWGQLDLVGNLWQWTVDAYANPYTDPCVDCADFDVGPTTTRVVRGGEYLHGTDVLSPPYRNYFDPSTRSGFFGFRCARTP